MRAHLPAGKNLRVVFRLARGICAGRLDPQFCGFDGPVTPIAISGSPRAHSHRRRVLFAPRRPQYAGRLTWLPRGPSAIMVRFNAPAP